MTPDGVELTVQSEGKQSQPSFLVTDWGPTLVAVRRRFADIARAEFRKHRKRPEWLFSALQGRSWRDMSKI